MKKNIGIYFLSTILLLFFACSNEKEWEEKTFIQVKESNFITLKEAQKELEKLLVDIDLQKGVDIRGGFSGKRVIEEAFALHDAPKIRTGNTENDSTALYVFNFKDNKGYAIIDGRKSSPSLLALTNEGHFSFDDDLERKSGIRPARFMTYDPNEEEFTKRISGGGTTTYGEWENIIYKPGGYCPVKWGQGYPYNNDCPFYTQGVRGAAGCVAVAIGQLMATYQYPNTYNGVSFDWKSMTDDRWGKNTTFETQKQISYLMKSLGEKENLNMKYGKESGSDSENIPKTLRNFGFSNGGEKMSYDTDKLVAELQKGYSVLLTGYSLKKIFKFLGIKIYDSHNGGHCWLVHGLLERRRHIYHYYLGRLVKTETESQWYPLCNWGWKGKDDGYYLSWHFDTNDGLIYTEDGVRVRGNERYNYQHKIEMIIGIRK